jgi:16S rRNA (cytosine1402-N4)-methyltransferase
MHQNKHKHHNPVLLHEVLSLLQPQAGESYLDLTAGYGGHAKEVLTLTNAPELATLVDRDSNAHAVLDEIFGKKATLVHADFESAAKQLKEQGKQFDIVLGDLGVSSPHLNDASRGFSVQTDGPLDMRMDNRQSLTAEEIVNTYSKQQLMKLLREYGEEPKAAKIAQAIIDNRPLCTTKELATLVAASWKGKSKTHPAIRTFQALRIEVNDELGMLKRSLPSWIDLLKPGGRIAIISFHSLEDRLVKQYFSDLSKHQFDATLTLLNKKPIMASNEELVFNPRARSAKLRAAVKIKRKG